MTNEELNELIDKNRETIADLKEKINTLFIAKTANEARIEQLENSLGRIKVSTARWESAAESVAEIYESDDFLFNDTQDVKGFFYEKLSKLLDTPIKSEIEFSSMSTSEGGSYSKGFYNTSSIIQLNGREKTLLILCLAKAEIKNVQELIDKQVAGLINHFPDFKNHKYYLGIASFYFYPELEEFAKENGVAILKQKGDVVEIEADYLKVY